MTWTDEQRAAAKAAGIKALLDEGGGPGNSIHSWRCEYPDTYGNGPCDCVEQTVVEILRAALAAVSADAANSPGFAAHKGNDSSSSLDGPEPEREWGVKDGWGDINPWRNEELARQAAPAGHLFVRTAGRYIEAGPWEAVPDGE